MNTQNGYMTTWIDMPMSDKPTVALITRPDGRQMTSAMLGEMNGVMLATLGQVFDLAWAMLQNDGTVSVKFPSVGAV